MVGPAVASDVAAHHRALRRRGVIVWKTIDLLIGAFCIRGRHALVHDNRALAPMVERLDLLTM